MKVTRKKSNTELALPEIIASKSKAALNPRIDSDLQAGLRPRKPARRRPRTPVLGRLARRSRPETPLLKWKVDTSEDIAAAAEEEEEKETDRRDRRRGKRGSASAALTTSVSARKLAAGLWRLQVPETVVGGGDGKRSSKLGFEYGIGHERVPLTHHRSTKLYGSEKEYLQSPGSSSRNGYAKVRPSLQLSNSAMEGVTKWDPVGLKAPDDSHVMYRQMKLADQQVSAVTVVAALEAELDQARSRIHELESERKSSKKKLDHFLRKVSEEKAAWRSREHEKVRMYIDDTKSELTRERKARQRAEVLNSKLVNELADAKLSAKRLLQECEKERKSRELIEEVCDELAREIGEDKAEVEALRQDSMRAREEVDDERKMLQMAEVWREERVQMKLVDAKVALEEKYSEMNRLVADLTRFMASMKEVDPKEEREAEKLRRVAGAVSVSDVKEFSYEPPNPDDIFSVFEEVNFGGEPGERVHTVSPETTMVKQNRDEDESGWETVSHADDQGSSFSPESVNNKNYASEDEEDDDDITEITEVCSVPAKQFKKGSSIARLWRSRSNNGGEEYKIVSVDNGGRGRISNAGTMSPELSPSELPGQWSSPDSGTGARGINRCIPRPGQKHSLKAKLLEARMESQKVQLRHVLKQKY